MQTTESCRYCEKVLITLEAKKPISGLLELPNTFNPAASCYEWVRREPLGYALVPLEAEGRTARVELYLCLDEDDLDDIDIHTFTNELLMNTILPVWEGIAAVVSCGDPVLSSPPVDMECWKVRHVH